MSDLCGCCAVTPPVGPEANANPPNLPALAYRMGTHSSFLQTMLARLSGLTLEIASASGSGVDVILPLARLTTRERSDPTIALLDAWACIADVLTFYQERIANEGYLGTAIERRSVIELARLIGYRPRPGVAASVKLAFTVANGFRGALPAGTRAQSVPAGSESPQFYETSAPLDTRDEWNRLAPRRTRPELITPPAADANGPPVVTGADALDTLYLDGIVTNLKPGDALLFVFGAGAPDPTLRLVAQAVAEPDAKRTAVRLAPTEVGLDLRTIAAQAALFPNSDIARTVSDILETVIANMSVTVGMSVVADLARGAIAALLRQRDLADRRKFSRLTAWIDRVLARLTETGRTGILPFTLAPGSDIAEDGAAAVGEPPTLRAMPTAPAATPLTRLQAIVAPLSKAPSAQPSSPLRLRRSLASSFGAQSDAAPRLLAALNPAAAPALYEAWTAVSVPGQQLQVLVPRAKVGLFAGSWVGIASTRSHIEAGPGVSTVAVPATTVIATSYTPPTIRSAWQATADGASTLPFLALDAVYDQIKPGSWVAITRPAVQGDAGTDAVTSFHLVAAVRTTNMDTGQGFAARVSQLVLTPNWLSGDTGGKAIESSDVLRRTVVYAQSEALQLAEEPLDTDIEGATLDLDRVYDGLEPGRWVVVSGRRTDIPDVSGVNASELAMVAAVAQGAEPPLSVAFPLATPPFVKVFYTTEANADGDRLVVGMLSDPAILASLPHPTSFNQQYSRQVELDDGLYANAYVPTAGERAGAFPSFAGMLVAPVGHYPFADGTIPQDRLKAGLFAWRIGSDRLHTILTLANGLAYKYDRVGVTIYGNVADATHGQSVGEILGNGNAATPFQRFGLQQVPLTWTSAPTPSGVASSLVLRVNELAWQEQDDLAEAFASQRAFVTSETDAQKTAVTFGDGVHGARLPTGTANVKATYRYGLGSGGNVLAGQIKQLATHPLGAQDVINPLPATGGADPDRIDQARANAPTSVMALDRLVSVQDYADFARRYAGIGKAHSVRLSDGRRQVVYVTVAGADDIPIDAGSDLYRNLLRSLQDFGDPSLPVAVGMRRLRLLVIAGGVGLRPGYDWDQVGPAVNAALRANFAFRGRALGQPAYASEAIRTVQDVEGVAHVNLTAFGSVADDIDAAGLAALDRTLGVNPCVASASAGVDATARPGSAERLVPAELVFLTPAIPATLIMTQADP